MSSLLLKNATIVNENTIFRGGIFVDGDIISDIYRYESEEGLDKEVEYLSKASEVLDLEGLYVAPGIIDTHVHFREPGPTHKATIASESAAAALGGVTSYFDMPNNNPLVTSIPLLEEKFKIAERDSVINFSFFIGATEDNLDEIKKLDPKSNCGVKIFLGASTGNMLLDEPAHVEHLFKESPLPIVAHCEDNGIIIENTQKAKSQFGDEIPFEKHPEIRSKEACIKSTKFALDVALRSNAMLHIAHLSTAEEVKMIKEARAKSDKITCEACVGYLVFDENDYSKYGSLIKCNPAIKTSGDKKAIRKGVREDIVSTIATDHAPHLLSEKKMPYLQSPSGTPYVQFGFLMMLDLVKRRVFKLETIIDKMAHSPARIFNIEKRGYIRRGYFADLVVFDLSKKSSPKIAYKCGWSPLSKFSSTVLHTIVNGQFVVKNCQLTDNKASRKIKFSR